MMREFVNSPRERRGPIAALCCFMTPSVNEGAYSAAESVSNTE